MEKIRRDKAFILAMKAGMWKYKVWVMKAFTFVQSTDNSKDFDIYQITENGSGVWVINIDGKPFELVSETDETLDLNFPVYKLNGKLTITKEDVSFLKEPYIETRYGKMILNYIMLYDILGDKVPYINSEINAGKVEREVYGKGMLIFHENPDHPDAISVEQYKHFGSNVSTLEGYASMCVPSSSEKSLQTHPEMKKMIKEFVEKNKDRMHEPVVNAELNKMIEQMDREWLRNDPTMRFFLNEAKSFGITRKGMYASIGGKAGMSDGQKLDFIEHSLAEGTTLETLAIQHNETRSGSYDRGVQTAMGGSLVKDIMLIAQNVKIEDGDCKSDMGILRQIRDDNKARFMGLSYLNNKFEAVEITDENIKSLIGKTLEIRSPAYCRYPSFCSVCMGKNNSRIKSGAGAEAMSFGSGWMYVFMKAMHGKVLSIQHFDYKEWMH